MPDGDKVHDRLERRYQKSYKQLCEGKVSGAEFADGLVETVWQDMKQSDPDDVLIHVLKDVAKQLQDILARKMFEEIDWQREEKLMKAKTRIYANKAMREAAAKACEEEYRAIRHGVYPSNCLLELISGYMTNVYESKFVECLPLTPKHYRGVSTAFVGEQLEIRRPFVKAQLQPYIRAIYEKESVHLSRKPKRLQAKTEFTIDSDVPTLGA